MSDNKGIMQIYNAHWCHIVLWLNANFGTGFRKQKFGEKPGRFDL